MVTYLCPNHGTRKRYFGSALILTFPPRRANLANPFAWMRFGMAMCLPSVAGAADRESSASSAARSSRTYS
jgi:hypothetical protein